MSASPVPVERLNPDELSDSRRIHLGSVSRSEIHARLVAHAHPENAASLSLLHGLGWRALPLGGERWEFHGP
jgi:hypothetical protein